MVLTATSLVGFNGEIKWPLGQITLLVKVGDDEHSTSTWMDFMVIAEHKLNVRKDCQPVRQKKRGQAAERNIAINDEREFAFKQMKEHIAKLPMLTAPEEEEELIVYLAASKEAVSAVLMTERKQTYANNLKDKVEESGRPPQKEELTAVPARWTLFTDGSSCVDGCGAGVILTDPEGVEFTYALRFQFETTNNE
ncbi:reverse transcriptase domain-containing protein [Tanacetum coccineum]